MPKGGSDGSTEMAVGRCVTLDIFNERAEY